MVFSRVIIGFIIFRKCKLPNPNKIYAIMNMHVPHNSLKIKIWHGMAWHNFIDVLSIILQ
jgi:hypothetical protein